MRALLPRPPRGPALLLVVLLAAAPAAAQVATDPAGDATHRTPAGDAGRVPEADLLGLDINDSKDALTWTVALAAGQEPAFDVDVRIAFGHGSRLYEVVASESTTLWISDGVGVAQRLVGELEGGREGTELWFRLPKDLVRDEAGMPLGDAALLAGIVVATAARDEVQGPDPEQGFFCCTPWWTVHDRMPDGGSASYRLPSGDADSLRLWSDAPLRASNGGGDRFVYSITATNQGDQHLSAPVRATDAPEGWNVTLPAGHLDLQAGTTHTFPLVVETQSGHRHGGTETLQVRFGNASTRIGIHYLDVAQPAGHHPRLFFHSQAVEGGVIETGYAPGRLWMNTLEDDPLDDGAAVDSTHSSFGGGAASWSICLAEGLRLGLQLANGTGETVFSLTAQRPYGDVRVSGFVYRYAPGPAQPCDADAYRQERNETLVASIPPSDAQAVQGSTSFTAPVIAEAGRIPHEEGAMLLLELTATFTVPDSQAPGPLVLESGGFLRLPLREYRDPVDVEVPVWQQEILEADLSDEPRGQESPAGFLALFAVLLAARRRA